jgi:hypothetical protein
VTGDASRPSTGSKQPIDLPIRRAMPAPLLIVFGLFGIVALAAGVWLLLDPLSLATTPVEERRPPPGSGYTHDLGSVAPAPTPSAPPSVPPPCDAFAATRLAMSGDGVLRMREALDRLCRLSGGGVSEELAIAIEGLGDATIRFAQFEISAPESTTSLADRTIWLNLRFARRGTPIEDLLPPLLHEGFHLGSGVLEPTAAQELAARRAEVDACRQLITRSKWPRWCDDADALTSLPESEAIRLLRAAGFDAA